MLSACAAAPAFAQSECRDSLLVVGRNAQSAFKQSGAIPVLTVFTLSEVPTMIGALNSVGATYGTADIERVLSSDRADALLLTATVHSVVVFSREGCFTGRAIVASEDLEKIIVFLVRRRA